MRKETVSKNSFKNNSGKTNYPLFYDMFLPTTKQAVTKRLMHMQSICNILIMSVTYFSLPVTALNVFYIFRKSKVKQF